MPTGVALRDVREQLFEAAERILLRDGPSALTSRATTAEAGVAKGVMYRHFSDFDVFLAELVEDRIGRIRAQGAALLGAAGTGTVAGNLTAALTGLFGPVAVAIVALVTFRDDLRARLHQAGHSGIPIMAEGTAMIASYLTAERGLGRITPDADVGSFAPTLIGAVHMVVADRKTIHPDDEAVGKIVTTVIAGALREPPRP